MTDTKAPSSPTREDPIPAIAGSPGLAALRSGVPRAILPKLSPDDRRAAVEAAKVAIASLQPANLVDVAEGYEGLALHFSISRKSQRETDMAIGHWLQDLEDMPADLFALACAMYRRGDASRMPTVGQLRSSVAAILQSRQILARRAADFLAEAGG